MNFGKYKSSKDYTTTKNDISRDNYINQRLSTHPCGNSNHEADKDGKKNWIEKNHVHDFGLINLETTINNIGNFPNVFVS